MDIETVPDMDASSYQDAMAAIRAGGMGPDQETYWKCTQGALRPTQGRVILVTYQINNFPVIRLKEWEKGERRMLKKFYILLQDLQRYKKKNPLHIIGHNVLAFDMLFLYSRMRIHKIDDEHWLYYWVINGPLMIDMLQLHLPINGMSARGLKHDVLAHAYGLDTTGSSGEGVTDSYFAGKYKDILDYSDREFVYPEMFQKICRDGIIPPRKLAASIQWYQDRSK